jgi:hypothetical protein
MGRAPFRFCFEGSLCYITRVEVGPLLCEPVFMHWCLLLPTPYIASLFDTEVDIGVKDVQSMHDNEWGTLTSGWLCQMPLTVSISWLLDACLSPQILRRVCQVVESACRSPGVCTSLSIMCQDGLTLESLPK